MHFQGNITFPQSQPPHVPKHQANWQMGSNLRLGTSGYIRLKNRIKVSYFSLVEKDCFHSRMAKVAHRKSNFLPTNVWINNTTSLVTASLNFVGLEFRYLKILFLPPFA